MKDSRKRSGKTPPRESSEPRDFYRALFEESADGMLVSDPQGRFVAVNPRGVELTGYSAPELLGMTVTDLLPPEDPGRDPLRAEDLCRGRTVVVERNLRRKDGGTLPVEIGARMLADGNLLGIVRDITERRRGEETLRRLARLHAFLTQVNQAIARNRDRDELFRALCRVAVQFGRFRMAWIALLNGTGRSVVPFTHAGQEDGYLRDITVTKEDGPLGGGPTGTALREGKVVVCDDVGSDPRMLPWREEALRRGYRSSAAVPFRLRDRVVGTLNLYAAEPFFFTGDERKQLEEIGVEISFALDAMALESDRAAAEGRERENAERLRVALSTVDMAVFTQDRDLRYTWMQSPQLGYTPEHVVGRTDAELLTPEAAARVGALKRRVVRDGVAVREVVAVDRDGRTRYFDLAAEPARDPEGKIVGLLGATHDITDLWQAKESLRESDARLNFVISNSPAVLYTCRPSGDYGATFVSSNVENQLGYPPDAFTADPGFWAARLHPDDAPRVLTGTAELFANGSHAHEYRFRHRNGTWRWMRDEMRLLRNGAGDPSEIVGYWVDVTGRKRTEEDLRESEEKFRNLFHLATDGIFILDTDGRFLDVNATAHERLGYSREEMLGRNIRELDPPEFAARVPERLAELRSRGRAVFESAHVRKDGTVMPVEVNSRVIPFGDRQVYLSIIRDLTDRRKAGDEKAKLQEQLFLAQKMESVGRLAGGVAHDFNNMLGVILGYAELLLQKVGPEDPHHGKLVEIRNAAQRSADLTRQLLAFARRQTVAPRILDLNDTVSSMLKMLRRIIGEDIDLVWKPGAGLLRVRIDPAQVDQVLANLCVNARDAIGGAGRITIGTENATVEEDHRAGSPGIVPGDYVMITVSDDGTGMGKEVLEHVFEPFFTTKPVGEGTGLGLATVYGIVKQNEGFVYVDSEPGKGSTFRIYLPPVAGEAAGTEADSAPEAPRGRGETLLLVEDEAAILDVGRTMLEGLGYTVLAVRTPEEALRISGPRAGGIHLLITDVVMPGMNGRELADRLGTIDPGLKCLFMSGYTADAIVHRGVLDEGVNFLQKPFTLNGLARKVREALDGSASPGR